MNYKIVLLLFTGFLSATSGMAQLPDSLKAHLDTAFSIMEKHSLYAGSVDWQEEKTRVYQAAATAKNKDELFELIASVYDKLNDHHGWFEQYDKKRKLPATDTREATAGMKTAWAKGPKVVARMIGTVAYLRVPGMHVYSQERVNFCANWLADSVRSLSAKHPTGWIIDLRLNTGGHIMPMMAGLASFFGEGPLSYYLDRKGAVVSRGVIRQGNYFQDDSLSASLSSRLPDLRKAKVAVLIGSGTGSSGEGVAINFKDRKKTRSFGEPTAGFANATEGFVFNNEQSYFLLTTSAIANKKRVLQPASVYPQVTVKHNDLFENMEADHAVKAALIWLK